MDTRFSCCLVGGYDICLLWIIFSLCYSYDNNTLVSHLFANISLSVFIILFADDKGGEKEHCIALLIDD